MDQDEPLGQRGRRALPLIAAALTVIVVASLLYIRANASQSSRRVLGAPPVPQLDSQYRVAYDFLGGSTGWAVVVSAAARGPRFSVFRTSDGARHWRKQFTGATVQGTDLSIQFLDSNVGILQLDRVYRTVDGGAHWGVISIPDDSPIYTFISPTRAWALDGQQLFATADGGLTWQMRGNVPQSIRGVGKGGPQALAFGATGEVWAGAIDQIMPTVYATSDGGATWKAIAVPHDANAVIVGGKPLLYSTSAQTVPGGGVLVLAEDDFGNAQAATSFDMGRSWNRIRVPTQDPQRSVYSFLDARRWWASFLSLLYRTDDGGQTWRVIRSAVTDSMIDWTIGSAHMIDARRGWAPITSGHGTSGLAMTNDGGLHWAPVNVPQPG